MSLSGKPERWVWRELVWTDALAMRGLRGLFEYLAATPSLGMIAFEARATAHGVRWLVAAQPNQIEAVTTQCAAYLPVRTITPQQPRSRVEQAATVRITGILAGDDERVHAAVRGLYGVFGGLRKDEQITLQVLLGRRHRPPLRPRESWHDWLMLLTGTPNDPRPTSTAHRQRAGQHGFSARIALGVSGTRSSRRVRQLFGDLGGALGVLESTEGRVRSTAMSTLALDQARPPWQWPLRLSSGEVVGLLGWPIADQPLPLVGGPHPRQLPPPQRLISTERVIGTASAPGHHTPIGIPIHDAAFHTHLLGPTGSAKSTVMLALIRADMAAGRNLLVLDPKGDLASDALTVVPPERQRDVVVIDPTNPAPIGFNPLAGHPQQASITADTLLATFRAVFAKHWGIRSADIFTAAFTTLAQTPGATLLWLPPLLTDPAFRRRVLADLDDPIGLGGFWDQYQTKSPAQQAEMIGPVLNKLRQLILRPSLRAVLGQTAPRFALDELFQTRRIVIVNLNKGLLGTEAARLLGSLLIGQLWTRILARQRDGRAHRPIVPIYIDEVHDFLAGIPGDLSDALAQARSLGTAFVLANQYRAQLDPVMQAAIESNTRNKLYFGLGGSDAAAIAKHIPELDAQDFLRLPAYHAYTQLMQQGQATGWISIATTPPPRPCSDPAALYAASHQHYGVAAHDTERHLRELISPHTPPNHTTTGPIGRTPRATNRPATARIERPTAPTTTPSNRPHTADPGPGTATTDPAQQRPPHQPPTPGATP